MVSLFFFYRWTTFCFFIVCNAVVCSVAAWNMSFIQSVGRIIAVDSYLIFLGAFGLVVIFPILFVDVLRRGAVSSRVWFEVSWVFLFWVLYFAASVAVSAITPGLLCDITVKDVTTSPCTSTEVLMVFTWLCTGAMFLYFFILSVFAVMHQKDDCKVWHSSVREFPWFATKEALSSTPNTPVGSRFIGKKPPSFAAPKARRPPPIFIQQRAGLNPQYEIEHFPDPQTLEQTLPPNPNPVLKTKSKPAAPLPPANVIPNAFNLYPHHVQTTILNNDSQQTFVQLPSANNAVPQSNASYTYTYTSNRLGSSPPPIRNWPRPLPNTQLARERSGGGESRTQEMRQKLDRGSSQRSENIYVRASSTSKGKGKARAEGALDRSVSTSQSKPDVDERPLPVTATSSEAPPSSYQSSRNRPTGPRTRSPKPRPPPLDLSKSRPPTSRRR